MVECEFCEEEFEDERELHAHWREHEDELNSHQKEEMKKAERKKEEEKARKRKKRKQRRAQGYRRVRIQTVEKQGRRLHSQSRAE